MNPTDYEIVYIFHEIVTNDCKENIQDELWTAYNENNTSDIDIDMSFMKLNKTESNMRVAMTILSNAGEDIKDKIAFIESIRQTLKDLVCAYGISKKIGV